MQALSASHISFAKSKGVPTCQLNIVWGKWFCITRLCWTVTADGGTPFEEEDTFVCVYRCPYRSAYQPQPMIGKATGDLRCQCMSRCCAVSGIVICYRK